ncbi:hypothetical protein [Natronolimnohabitans innermongolicus]|uniref:hypothetical protein n=1 Tax=Natronolimnohabitans innermongolicus TaxID=253107 RepID=UPI0006782145|nr:hypothetical protein [Natronolimnohabitans innermongolicus]
MDVTRVTRKTLDRSQLWSIVVYVSMVGLATFGGGYLAYRAGTELRTGGPFVEIATMPDLRGLVAVFWLVIVLGAFVVRSVGLRGSVDATGGLLAEASTRTVVVGLVLADFVYGLVWFGPPAVAIGIGFAVGTGNLAAVAFVPLGAIAFVVSTVTVGTPVGIALRHVVSRYAFVARFKNVLILLIIGGYMIAIMTGQLNELMGWLVDPMSRSPMGWLADLSLLGTPDLEESVTNAILAVGLTVLVVPIGLAVTTWLASIHWFTDPVSAEPDDHVVEPTAAVVGSEPGPVEGVLERLFGRPTAALVVLAYRRTARAPMKLLYAVMPLLLLSGTVPLIIELGEIPRFLVVPLLLAIVWGAGMLFVLNPLGDQGSVLPATLLTTVSGREFVGAHVVASLAIALPVGIVVTALAAAFSPLPTATSLALVVASPGIILLGSVVAIGFGMAFPRFSSVNITQSTKAVVPSKLAFLFYTVYLLLTTVAGAVVYDEGIGELVAALLSAILPFGLVVSSSTLYGTSVVALVPLVVLPFVGGVYAVRRFEAYTLD